MILVDTDVLLIDLRYPLDSKYAVNRQVLDQIHIDGTPLAITSQTLLEVVGIMSFNVSPADVLKLPNQIIAKYGLTFFPDILAHPKYARCTHQELFRQMSLHMALGDAVQAIQIQHCAPQAFCLLTWNAKHFVGKLVVPVLTPEEWLQQRGGSPTP